MIKNLFDELGALEEMDITGEMAEVVNSFELSYSFAFSGTGMGLVVGTIISVCVLRFLIAHRLELNYEK